MPRIQVNNQRDRWRYLCPKGHRTWEPVNNHFWCQRCARTDDDRYKPEFDELLDKKTGESVPRDEIQLVSEFGDPMEGSA